MHTRLVCLQMDLMLTVLRVEAFLLRDCRCLISHVSRPFFSCLPLSTPNSSAKPTLTSACGKNRTSAWRKYPLIDSDITSPEAIHAQYNRATYIRRSWHLHQTHTKRLPEDRGGLMLFGEHNRLVRSNPRQQVLFCRRSRNTDAPIIDVSVWNDAADKHINLLKREIKRAES